MHVSSNHDIYMGGATGLVAIRESSLSYPPKIYDLELAHLYVNNKAVSYTHLSNGCCRYAPVNQPLYPVEDLSAARYGSLGRGLYPF